MLCRAVRLLVLNLRREGLGRGVLRAGGIDGDAADTALRSDSRDPLRKEAGLVVGQGRRRALEITLVGGIRRGRIVQPFLVIRPSPGNRIGRIRIRLRRRCRFARLRGRRRGRRTIARSRRNRGRGRRNLRDVEGRLDFLILLTIKVKLAEGYLC